MSGSLLTLNGGKWQEDNGFGGSWTGPVSLTANSTIQNNGNFSINGDITGAGGLIKTSNATLSRMGVNSYTGTTVVNAGILSLPTSAALYNADTGEWTPENITVASGAAIRINVGGAGEFTGSEISTLFANLGTVNNNGLKAGSAFGFDTTNSGANVVDVTGDIVDSTGPGGGALKINKYGAGTLRLSGDNTFTGPVLLHGGYLSVDSFNSVNGGSPPLASSSLGRPTTVADGTINLSQGGLAFNNGFIYNGSGETTDRVINLIGGAPANLYLDQSGTGLLNFTSQFTAVGSNSTNFGIILQGSTEGTGELSAVVPVLRVGATTNIVKSGTGTWTLSNANTYNGTTTINGGALVLTDATSVPGGISTAGGTSAITFNGGVLGLGEGDFTRSLKAGVDGATFNNTAGGWAAYGADRLVNLGGAAASIVWGTATTGFNSRTLILGAATATHTVTLQNPLNLETSFRTVQADDGAAAIDGILSGDITGTGSGGLVKTGLGALSLTGAVNYTTMTSVNAGNLIIGGAAQLNGGTYSGTYRDRSRRHVHLRQQRRAVLHGLHRRCGRPDPGRTRNLDDRRLQRLQRADNHHRRQPEGHRRFDRRLRHAGHQRDRHDRTAERRDGGHAVLWRRPTRQRKLGSHRFGCRPYQRRPFPRDSRGRQCHQRSRRRLAV